MFKVLSYVESIYSLVVFLVYADKNYAYAIKNRTSSPYLPNISYVL